MRTYIAGGGVKHQFFNTSDPTTGEGSTLGGTPSCRGNVNGAAGVADGFTLTVDDGGYTGNNKLTIDPDDVTLALGDQDEVHPYIHAGTVATKSMAGKAPHGLEDFLYVAAGLSSADQQSVRDALGVDTDMPATLAVHDGDIQAQVSTDAGNSATTFKQSHDSGTKTLVGFLFITSGALIGERCLGKIVGTQFTALSHPDMPAELKQFSGIPADNVTFTFRPI